MLGKFNKHGHSVIFHSILFLPLFDSLSFYILKILKIWKPFYCKCKSTTPLENFQSFNLHVVLQAYTQFLFCPWIGFPFSRLTYNCFAREMTVKRISILMSFSLSVEKISVIFKYFSQSKWSRVLFILKGLSVHNSTLNDIWWRPCQRYNLKSFKEPATLSICLHQTFHIFSQLKIINYFQICTV